MFSLYNVFHLRYILSLESHSLKPFAQVKAYLAHRTKIWMFINGGFFNASVINKAFLWMATFFPSKGQIYGSYLL